MCTCITYENGDFYFGRNLDLEYVFGERVVITPRNYIFPFRKATEQRTHYAMIGMATVAEEYPLYAEAVNEKGLGMAGLNFPGNACYKEYVEDKDNITPFELIPWVLGQCKNVEEAEACMKNVNVLNVSFAEKVPLSPLHWMIADRTGCIVVEAVNEGVKIYKNPYGVMTNNPPFSFYQEYMNHFMNLSVENVENRFAEQVPLKTYGQGMGAIGLPGDYSPASRFVKAAFLRNNGRSQKEELSNVSQFFHMLEAVSMVRGAVITPQGLEDITTYSCCVNCDKGIYYYKTYDNSQIQAVDMRKENLDDNKIKIYKLNLKQEICWQN